MTNPTTRELALVEAALKAAAEKCDNAGWSKEPTELASMIRSLDLAAIVASVPPHQYSAVVQDNQEVLTDAEIEDAFVNTNFGHSKYRGLLAASVFKKLVGYHCGHTITVIMQELGLIGKTGAVTNRGKRFVSLAYNHSMICSG